MKHGLWVLLLVTVFGLPRASSAETIVEMSFPVGGDVSFINDFGYPRVGHTHQGNDIMAPKMAPIFAPLDGEITYAPMVQPSYGYMLKLKANNGYTFQLLHLNNDAPGTDNGRGGVANAYAPGIAAGVQVVRGQLLGWVGDSGNAESTPPHLHFEIYNSAGRVVNPYTSLMAALQERDAHEASLRMAAEVTINDNLNIPEEKAIEVNCESDSLIKTADSATVYYCGRDGGRYVFQDESTFFSWYSDFKSVKVITTNEMAKVPLKGVVTYKPGSSIVKLQSSPKVFAVGESSALRWITTPEIATAMFGVDWTAHVRDLPDSFFSSYEIADEIVY